LQPEGIQDILTFSPSQCSISVLSITSEDRDDSGERIDMSVKPKMLVQTIADVTMVDVQEVRLLESAQLDALGEELYRLVEQMNRKKLILDCGKVQFMASAAISVFLNLNKKVAAAKGTLFICGIRKELMQVFEIMRLTKLFQFVANEEEAFKRLGYAGKH